MITDEMKGVTLPVPMPPGFCGGMVGVGQGVAAERNPAHEDRIERLDRLFYIRWTSGPDYEKAFICIEDGEPDMNDIATVSFKRAELFAAAYRAGKPIPLS